MKSEIETQAEELAMRPYTEVMFRDRTTDGDYIYMAVTPELNGCMAQGETMREARENLREFRIEYLEHYLKHDIPIPPPAWMRTNTEADSIQLYVNKTEKTLKQKLAQVIQPEEREELYEASLSIDVLT